jgi:hypothetical protein
VLLALFGQLGLALLFGGELIEIGGLQRRMLRPVRLLLLFRLLLF